MKIILPIILVIATVVLIAMPLVTSGNAAGKTVGIAVGSAFYGLTPKPSTPEQALSNLLLDAKRRNWDLASTAVSNLQPADKQSFIQDWTGSYGSLRSFSALEGFDIRPL